MMQTISDTAPPPPYLTVGELGTIYGVETWRIRRAVDALNVPIPRAAGSRRSAGFRLVPRSLLGQIAQELERRGWLDKTSAEEVLPS